MRRSFPSANEVEHAAVSVVRQRPPMLIGASLRVVDQLP
jgi:hypothetical protein